MFGFWGENKVRVQRKRWGEMGLGVLYCLLPIFDCRLGGIVDWGLGMRFLCSGKGMQFWVWGFYHQAMGNRKQAILKSLILGRDYCFRRT